MFDEIPGVERDYVRYDKDAIEGRLFSAFPIHQEERVYKLDMLFNAAMLPAAVSNGPVTAANGARRCHKVVANLHKLISLRLSE